MLTALTPKERQDLILSIGVPGAQRRLEPIPLADLIERAQTTDTLEEIATYVNLQSTTILDKLLRLKRLPSDIHGNIHWGRSKVGVSFSVATEVARLDRVSDMRFLVMKAIEYQLSKSEVQAIVQLVLRKSCSLDDAVQEIVQTRPAIDRQYLYIGLLDSITSDKTAIKNIRRNLAKLVGPDNILTVRCSNGRFSILLSEKGAKSTGATKYLSTATLQSYINEIATG